MITFAGHAEQALLGNDLARRHGADREGAGLIRADDLGATQRLHRRQTPDQGIAPHHALYAQGERHGHHRRQPFGNRCHCQTHRVQEQFERLVRTQESQPKHNRYDSEANPQEAASDAIQPVPQGGFIGSRCLQQPGDMPDFGVHARRHDQGASGTVDDVRAEKDHVAAIGQRGFLRQHCDPFLHGLRLAGEGGLIGLQDRSFDQTGIRRYQIAGLQ